MTSACPLSLGHSAALPLLGLLFAISGAAVAADPAAELRVMSFNIRYGTANDGDNNWTLRRDFLVETIRAFDPDLLHSFGGSVTVCSVTRNEAEQRVRAMTADL